MKKPAIQHHMDGLLALLIFGVFAVCVLAVLLTGANAYRRLTQRDQASYTRRTCVQYLTTRVRQADRLDAVAVEPFGGVDALVLTEEGGYQTRVYCYDGYLMELYAAVGADLSPEDGERIMESGGLALSLSGGRLTANLTGPDGVQDVLVLSLRSREGAAA